MVVTRLHCALTILRHCCNITSGLTNQLIACFKVKVKVPFGTKFLDAALCIPTSAKDAETAVTLTHGAGGDMDFKQLVSLAHALASAGFICMRFTCKCLNLGYRVKAYHAVWVSMFNPIKSNLTHLNIHLYPPPLLELPENTGKVYHQAHICWRQVNGKSCSSGFSQTAQWQWTRGGGTGCSMSVLSPAPAWTDTRPSAAKWRSQGFTWTPTCTLCVRHWRPHVWQGEEFAKLLNAV